jgi:RNA polymerase sigma-70 factor, ECF subfamily
MKDRGAAGHYFGRRLESEAQGREPDLTTEAEFKRHFEQHRRSVMAFVLRRVPTHEAEDVVAETFLVAWRRQEKLPAEPLPWLLAVARKVIATNRRGSRRLTNLHEKLNKNTARIQTDNSPEDRSDLMLAFNSLSDRDKEVLMLIGWDGLSVTEAAGVLGCSSQQFSVRLHRARGRLEARMETGAPFLAGHAASTTEETT